MRFEIRTQGCQMNQKLPENVSSPLISRVQKLILKIVFVCESSLSITGLAEFTSTSKSVAFIQTKFWKNSESPVSSITLNSF